MASPRLLVRRAPVAFHRSKGEGDRPKREAAIDTMREIDPWLVGCAAFAVLLFAAREVAAGVRRAMGGDRWGWVKPHRRAR